MAHSSDGNPLARHGGISFLELPARDRERSAAFYEQTLGWQIDRRANGDWRFSGDAGQYIGRFALDRAIGGESGILPYIYVDGLDAAVARATASGGEVVKAAYAEGDTRVATVRDPAGNVIGLWQFA
jgi:predicted enzyme related to lactoylglutathione lyase